MSGLAFLENYRLVRQRLWGGTCASRQQAPEPRRTYAESLNPVDFYREISLGPTRIVPGFAQIPPSARSIIRRVSDKHGVALEDVLGPRRHAKIIKARHEAIVSVVMGCPHFSVLRISKMFRRDHTSILHVLKKYGVERHNG